GEPPLTSIQFDRLLPMLVKLLQAGLGLLKGTHRVHDTVTIAVQVRRCQELFQLTLIRLALGNLGLEILAFTAGEASLAFWLGRCGRAGCRSGAGLPIGSRLARRLLLAPHHFIRVIVSVNYAAAAVAFEDDE